MKTKLATWCASFPTNRAASKALGVSAAALCRYLAGRIPSRPVAIRIEARTSGAVTLEDLGKERPRKACEFCGAIIVPRRQAGGTGSLVLGNEWRRRKYCSLRCYGDAALARDNCKPSSGRKRAHRIYEATSCALCGSTHRVQRHHRDMNPKNNTQENVMILCQTCHVREHKQSGTWGRPRAKSA